MRHGSAALPGQWPKLLCRDCGRAGCARGGWRSQSGLRLVPIWNRHLVVAVTMGALTSPGLPHTLLALQAPNLLITSYPLVMVPTFAVPLALMLHGLVL